MQRTIMVLGALLILAALAIQNSRSVPAEQPRLPVGDSLVEFLIRSPDQITRRGRDQEVTMEQGLNELGAAGWKLAAIQPPEEGMRSSRFVFQRVKVLPHLPN